MRRGGMRWSGMGRGRGSELEDMYEVGFFLF